MGLILPALLLLLMYVLLIRPQQQRVRRQRALVQSLDVGDRVVSIGGVVGRIVRLDDEMIDLEVADSVVLTFLRGAISRKLDEVSEPADPFDAADPASIDSDALEEPADDDAP